MFITNMRVKLPTEIEISGHLVETVSTFKLLVITIDNKFNFTAHCSNLSKIINRKMYSIKPLFYDGLWVTVAKNGNETVTVTGLNHNYYCTLRRI
jgi:hypothetical protein